jgi:quercetin dioxygenase-like cupin family protein
MIISAASAPTFTQGGTTAVGYASPSRGAADLSLWRIRLDPGAASPFHALSREEVFLVLDGDAVATLDGAEHPLAPGDCLVVPPGVPFAIAVGGGGFAEVFAIA